jgi:hypothetical protein
MTVENTEHVLINVYMLSKLYSSFLITLHKGMEINATLELDNEGR